MGCRRRSLAIRKCLECGKKFRPSKRSHLYHNQTCKNRASARRRRQRIRLQKQKQEAA